MGPKSDCLFKISQIGKYRVFWVYLEKPGKYPATAWVSCRFPQFCLRFCPRAQTSSQTQGNLEHLECSHQPHIQGRGAEVGAHPAGRMIGIGLRAGNSRVSRMEHQTPSVFPRNFRKRKVLGTLCFPFCLPEKKRKVIGPTLVVLSPVASSSVASLSSASFCHVCMYVGR